MTDKEKEEKEPLDLTTEETMKALFPQEVIDHLNEAIRENDEKSVFQRNQDESMILNSLPCVR